MWSFIRSRQGIVLLLLMAAGAALRFATVGRQSYWYDEAITASMLDRSLLDVFRGVVDTESTPPLYYVLAWGWGLVFGTDEAELRSFSALIGTLVVPVAYAAGRVAATHRTGVAAAALAAVSPMLVWYSQEARAYALLALLGGASFALFVAARRSPSRRTSTWWAVVSALAIATHYFAGFVVLAECVLLLRAHPRVRAIRWGVGGVGAFALCLLPLAAMQASHRRLGWVGGIDLTERVTEALQRLVTAGQPSSWWGATGAAVTPHVWTAAVAVLALAGALLLWRGSTEERAGGSVALQVAGLGIGLPVAMALLADLATGGDGDYFLDRNVLGAWVALAVFVAAGLAGQRSGVLGLVCLAAILGWSVVTYLDIATDPELQRDDWRSVAAVLPTSEASAVVVYPAYQSAALARQRTDLTRQTSAAQIDRIALVVVGFDAPPATFRVPEGFALSREDVIQHFLVAEYRADRSREVAPDDLSRGPVEDSDLGVLVGGLLPGS